MPRDEEEATLLLSRDGSTRDFDSSEDIQQLEEEEQLRRPNNQLGFSPSSQASSSIARVWRNVSSPPLRGSNGLLRRTFLFVTPSFWHERFFDDGVAKAKKPLHPTAYLDGMRGVAAFLVYFSHLAIAVHTDAIHGYGYRPQSGDADNVNWYSFWRLPIIRVVYNGEAMVAIFFIISGYALSYKPLKQIRMADYTGCYHTLASSTFRRAIRLYLPGLASTFIMAMSAQIGLYELTRSIALDKELLPGNYEWHIEPEPNIFAELWRWLHYNYLYLQPFLFRGGHPIYDAHLWTLPVELHASLLLFVTILGLAKTPAVVRIGLLLLLMWMGMVKDCWEMTLFYTGMVFAELELIRDTPTPGPHNDIVSDKEMSPSSKFGFRWLLTLSRNSFGCAFAHAGIRVLGVLLGLFFMSQPFNAGRTLFWQHLYSVVPGNFDPMRHFWPCIGSIILSLTVVYTPLLKRFFESPPCQYLGSISFSLYLMHNWTNHMFAYTAWNLLRIIMGISTTFTKETGWLIGCLINTAFLIWISDMFWRGVDKPSMRFARWLEIKCTAPEHSQPATQASSH